MDSMLALHGLIFMGGLGGLWYGGDLTVYYARRLAQRFAISTLVLGLVILALTADIPELAVTIYAALAGVCEVGVGDIIGGCFCDVAMVVGITLLAAGRRVHVSAADGKRLAMLLLFAAAVMLGLLCLGSIGFYTGLALIALYGCAIFYFCQQPALQEEVSVLPAIPVSDGEALWLLCLKCLGALAVIMLASHATVYGLLQFAVSSGIAVQSLSTTLLCIGTTLPELAVCLGAIRQGDFGLAIGPALGTILDKMTLLLGLLATLAGKPVSLQGVWWPCIFMVLACGILAVRLLNPRPMGNRTGVLLLSLFIAYLACHVVL